MCAKSARYWPSSVTVACTMGVPNLPKRRPVVATSEFVAYESGAGSGGVEQGGLAHPASRLVWPVSLAYTDIIGGLLAS